MSEIILTKSDDYKCNRCERKIQAMEIVEFDSDSDNDIYYCVNCSDEAKEWFDGFAEHLKDRNIFG